MQRAKYTAEFKEEVVRQVIDRGHSVIDVAKRASTRCASIFIRERKRSAVTKSMFGNAVACQKQINPCFKSYLFIKKPIFGCCA